MAYTTVNKSTDHFDTKLWTGTGAENAVTSVGFQPDFTWIKRRETNSHRLFDAVRGATKFVESDSTAAEVTDAQELKSFDSNGFTLGTGTKVNASGGTYAAWNWKGNGSGSSNGDGSITATVSANTTAGFSIVKYTGTGSNATVGHGLGVAPKMILFKDTTNGSTNWAVYAKEIGNDYRLTLNDNTARAGASSDYYQNTDPSSSVFYLGSNTRANASGAVTIAYCFAEVDGFCKISKYKGNNNSDGPFVYTGFKPAFVMVKNFDTAINWIILDNKRDTHPNPQKMALFPNVSTAETGDYLMDFNSTGFKVRTATSALNGNAQDLVYMAFAQVPLVGSNNIPALAR
mgnify:FL=1|jgi:hypothetical protein